MPLRVLHETMQEPLEYSTYNFRNTSYCFIVPKNFAGKKRCLHGVEEASLWQEHFVRDYFVMRKVGPGRVKHKTKSLSPKLLLESSKNQKRPIQENTTTLAELRNRIKSNTNLQTTVAIKYLIFYFWYFRTSVDSFLIFP